MRPYNFSAGPAALPLEVLEQARREMTDWNGSGMSVMEVSHRGAEFMAMAAEAESDLRELLAVPRGYRILFMQGGASAQFALVPLNLAGPASNADYINTGHWSQRAIAEACRYCNVRVAWDSGADPLCNVRVAWDSGADPLCNVRVAADAGGEYSRAPAQCELDLHADAAYVHYTPNETISGVEFSYVPETRGAPLIADMSSTILSRPIEVEKFGLIYAGAQKNIGPAGLTVVIVHGDLIGRARPETPRVFDYKAVAEERSLLNTPPTFAWYIAGLVFKWLKKNGGVAAMAERNRNKAHALYAAVDASSLYANTVAKDSRSWMNVTFSLNEPELEPLFIEQAAAAGLKHLKGHRARGGIRASLYNAMPLSGVEALIDFMREFERTH